MHSNVHIIGAYAIRNNVAEPETELSGVPVILLELGAAKTNYILYYFLWLREMYQSLSRMKLSFLLAVDAMRGSAIQFLKMRLF
jgi:hypothetical protein